MPRQYSIVSLGVRPLLLGFVLVEIAIVIVPVWRPLRSGGPAERARLHQASLIVGILLALGQACFFTVGLGAAYALGPGARTITIFTLAGATAAMAVLARTVDERGLGNGYAILLLAHGFPQIVGAIGNALTAVRLGGTPADALAKGVFGVAVLVGATLWMFSSFRISLDEAEPHPSLASRPACGVAPLGVVSAMLAMAAVLIQVARTAHLVGPPPPAGLAMALALNIPAAAFFAFLFNRPERVAGAWKALSVTSPGGIPSLKALMLDSVAFIVVVVVAQTWLLGPLGAGAPNTVMVILATGIISDLVREWRVHEACTGLVPVWEIHQVYAVAPVLRLLKAEGIQAFAKGLRLRSLLQFFGPYVPVQILVAPGQAPTARALLQARWPKWQMES